MPDLREIIRWAGNLSSFTFPLIALIGYFKGWWRSERSHQDIVRLLEREIHDLKRHLARYEKE